MPPYCSFVNFSTLSFALGLSGLTKFGSCNIRRHHSVPAVVLHTVIIKTRRRPSTDQLSLNTCANYQGHSIPSLYALFVSISPHFPRCPGFRANANMGLNAQHCSFVLLAEFDIDRGAQLTYQFPQPLGTDEGCVCFADRAPANRILTS
jgi:hypothetical protein